MGMISRNGFERKTRESLIQDAISLDQRVLGLVTLMENGYNLSADQHPFCRLSRRGKVLTCEMGCRQVQNDQ